MTYRQTKSFRSLDIKTLTLYTTTHLYLTRNSSSFSAVLSNAASTSQSLSATSIEENTKVESFLSGATSGSLFQNCQIELRILFFPDTPFVHMHPENPTWESGNFSIRSPEWKLLNPNFFLV